jgi:hypothetical protein
MIKTLEDLTGPDRVRAFLDHFVSKTPWGPHAVDATGVQSLLPWADIDRLIGMRGLPPDQLRVVANRNTAEPSMYQEPKSGRLRADVVRGFAEDGASLVFDEIGGLLPALNELQTNIEWTLREHVNINMYATFGRHSAFLPHADAHDILVVQIYGSKRWQRHGVHLSYPLERRRGRPPPNMPVVWEGVLAPGDLLYLPRGEVHAALPVDYPSVHLTIGIRELVGVDYVNWLVTQAGEHEVFRTNLARNANPGDRREREGALKAALHDLIDRTPLDAYFRADDAGRRLNRAGAFNIAGRLSPSSMLMTNLRRPVDLSLDVVDEVGIELGGEPIRLSLLARKALHLIGERRRMQFASLAAHLDLADENELLGVLTELGRKQLISVVDG